MIKHYSFLVLLLLFGCGQLNKPSIPAHVERIVSLAPSTTEILFALGLGDRVVGVTRFCQHPPEARALPSLGGLYDPNWETIAALRPDLVVGLDSQQEIAATLRLLQIPFLGVPHEHIDEILESIFTIGTICDAEAEATELVDRLRNKMKESAMQNDARTPQVAPPSVLVCISRDDSARQCYVAARDTLYDELIEMAGGINACMERTQKYPQISPEGLLALNPDIIIDIGSSAEPAAWRQYTTLPAVRNDRIAVVTNDYASVPGPRFVELLADFRKAIQP